MNKEILTTANINEVGGKLMELATNDNVTAQLVFQLNDRLNAIVPGRPVTKAAKSEITEIWDNIIIGLANDLADLGDAIKAGKGTVEIADLAVSFSDIRDGINQKDDKAKDGKCPEINEDTDMLMAFINRAISDVPVEDVAKVIGCAKEDIAKILDDDMETINKVTDNQNPAVVHTLTTTIWALLKDVTDDAEDEEEECSCDGCKNKVCECKEMSDDEFDEIAHQIYAILKEEGKHKQKTSNKLGTGFIVRKRSLGSINDIHRAMFDVIFG